MSIVWKDGAWPKEKFLWFHEDREWRVEIDGTGSGYCIVVRRDMIRVASRPIEGRGDGMAAHVKREAEALFNSAKARDAQPQHKSHL